MIYDVAVIGGGPVGISVVGNLAPAGKSIVLFEKEKLGGVCLNSGCMPTKALLHSAKVLDTVNTSSKMGVHITGAVKAKYKDVANRKNMILGALNAGVTQNITNAGITVVNSFAKIKGEDETGNILVEADGKVYTVKNLILGAGSENIVPPIKGIDTSEYIDSNGVLALEEAPKSLTVIGGGVLGVEFASLFSSFGTKIDLVEMADEILPAMDKELAHILRKEYEKKGINFHLKSKAIEFNGNEVIILKDGKEMHLSNEKTLLAIGRKPSTKNLNLEALNLKTEKGRVLVDEHMKTSHPNVFACGDIIGGSMLAHTAMHEGMVASHSILGKPYTLNYDAIPAVVYTDPEIASVGASETQLEEKGIAYDKVMAPLAKSGRYILENDFETPGFVKVLLEKDTEKILGIHLLGNPASELISIAAMAIAKGFTKEELKKIVFPHPTIAGIFHNTL